MVENEHGQARGDNRLQIEKVTPSGLIWYDRQPPDPEELGDGGIPDAEAQQGGYLPRRPLEKAQRIDPASKKSELDEQNSQFGRSLGRYEMAGLRQINPLGSADAGSQGSHIRFIVKDMILKACNDLGWQMALCIFHTY